MSTYKPQKNHAPVDDSVKLPAAIRAASARSDALHKQVYEQEEVQQNEGTQTSSEKEPPAQSTEKQDKPREEPNGSTNRQPETPKPQAEAPAKEGQGGSQGSNSVDWEHKYNSLKGRFDAQSGTISHLTSRLSDMERMLATLSEKKPSEQPPSELTFEPLKPEEIETYGEDFISVAQRAALAKVSPEVARLSGMINDLQKQLGQVTASTQQTTKQTLFQFLDANLANWRDLNRNPDFLEWANLPDPFSGVTRIEMMREAFNKGDGPRVLNFFKGFLNDEAATAPATLQPDPKPQGQKVPLEQFAAPGRAKAPAASNSASPGEKETITHAQIAEFYRLVNAGKYKGNEAEKNRIEQMIFEAQRDGRIV